MSGPLLPAMMFRALDSAGNPISGATLSFFQTGTLTPQAVYTSASLGTPTANPLSSDGSGNFIPVFVDPTKTYRVQIKDGSGTLLPDGDIDPVFAPFAVGAGAIASSMLAAGAALANLGYTPANIAGGSFITAEQIVGYTLTVGGDPKGVGFRGAPPVTKNAIYTFAADDGGKLYRHTDASAYAWTIPPNSSVVFPVGTIIAVRNFGAGVVTLTRGAGVTLALAGSGTNQNVALAQYAYGALIKEDTDTWIFSGVGGS